MVASVSSVSNAVPFKSSDEDLNGVNFVKSGVSQSVQTSNVTLEEWSSSAAFSLISAPNERRLDIRSILLLLERTFAELKTHSYPALLAVAVKVRIDGPLVIEAALEKEKEAQAANQGLMLKLGDVRDASSAETARLETLLDGAGERVDSLSARLSAVEAEMTERPAGASDAEWAATLEALQAEKAELESGLSAANAEMSAIQTELNDATSRFVADVESILAEAESHLASEVERFEAGSERHVATSQALDSIRTSRESIGNAVNGEKRSAALSALDSALQMLQGRGTVLDAEVLAQTERLEQSVMELQRDMQRATSEYASQVGTIPAADMAWIAQVDEILYELSGLVAERKDSIKLDTEFHDKLESRQKERAAINDEYLQLENRKRITINV